MLVWSSSLKQRPCCVVQQLYEVWSYHRRSVETRWLIYKIIGEHLSVV